MFTYVQDASSGTDSHHEAWKSDEGRDDLADTSKESGIIPVQIHIILFEA